MKNNTWHFYTFTLGLPPEGRFEIFLGINSLEFYYKRLKA
jgi:hypothetical protein